MVSKNQINKVLNNLSMRKDQKPYLSEAQFQFELAWELQKNKEKYNIDKILLEYTACSEKLDDGKKRRFESDIIVQFKDDTYIAIELKYKTAEAEVNGVKLIPQAGQPGTKYDYLWDIHRIELLTHKDEETYEYHLEKTCIGGYAIFLTNDSSYWGESNGSAEFFRLESGRTIPAQENLKWNVVELKDWMKSRKSFEFLHEQRLGVWTQYLQYNVKNKKDNDIPKEFRYLLTAIGDCDK